MILSHITAMSQNHVIGVNNELPWHIPEDLKFFKEKTKGHIMIMGRKTYESMGGALPNRFHIIITRQADYNPNAHDAVVVGSLKEAIEEAKKHIGTWGDEVFISGGGEIYAQSMDIVDRIYLTVIYKDYQGDTKYPKVDDKKFKLVEKKDRAQPVPFSFNTYEKI